MTTSGDNLFERAWVALMQSDPEAKSQAVRHIKREWDEGLLDAGDASAVLRAEVPGRPERPMLVRPQDVPKRKLGSLQGRLRLVHAVAHIEFNAINLALDAVYRFRSMPEQYYTDWLQVACEESHHFSLLQRYLLDHGSGYGEFDAHNGLWEMAVKTDSDVLVRMALVPRVLEARGLDVTPTMIRQLRSTGDERLIGILDTIFRDEIGHVRIGNHWYLHCCRLRNMDPVPTFFGLVEEYMGRALSGPFEHAARAEAGFTDIELELLEANAR